MRASYALRASGSYSRKILSRPRRRATACRTRSGNSAPSRICVPSRFGTTTCGRGFAIRPATAAAISSGSQLRCPFGLRVPATSSVLVNVGRTALTCTPRSATSSRAASVNATTAALLALYRARPGVYMIPATDATLITWPAPRGSIRSRASLVPSIVPCTLTSMQRRASASLSPVTGPIGMIPALLTRTPRGPADRSASSRNAVNDSRDVTSTVRPVTPSSAAASLTAASSTSPMTTAAPSAFRARAVASPIPRAAPVITTTPLIGSAPHGPSARAPNGSSASAPNGSEGSRALLQAFEADGEPVLGRGQRRGVQRPLVPLRDAPAVPLQDLVEDGLDLHPGEVHPDALVRAPAERRPRELVDPVLAALRGEPLGVEPVRVRPPLGHVVVAEHRHDDEGPRRDVEAEDRGVLDDLARQRRDGRDHPQRLLHHHVDAGEVVEVVVAGLRLAEGQALLAQPLLPLGVLGQVVGHRRHRDGGGVVRRHQREDHVVDDVLVGEPLAVVGRGLAEGREQVGASLAALVGEVPVEELLQHLAGRQSAVPAQPGDGEADVGGARPDGVDERAVDAVAFGVVQLDAHEDVHGEVEGELLDVVVHLEAVAGPPRLDALDDAGRHRLHVRLEPRAGERL